MRLIEDKIPLETFEETSIAANVKSLTPEQRDSLSYAIQLKLPPPNEQSRPPIIEPNHGLSEGPVEGP